MFIRKFKNKYQVSQKYKYNSKISRHIFSDLWAVMVSRLARLGLGIASSRNTSVTSFESAQNPLSDGPELNPCNLNRGNPWQKFLPSLFWMFFFNGIVKQHIQIHAGGGMAIGIAVACFLDLG